MLSEGLLLQHIDVQTADHKTVVEGAAIEFPRRSGARITPPDDCLMPLDSDVMLSDNSQSKGHSYFDFGF